MELSIMRYKVHDLCTSTFIEVLSANVAH